MDYKALLEYSFKFSQDVISPVSERDKALLDEAGVDDKIAWIGNTVFDFTTYDDGASMYFATKALEVCRAINECKTHEYQALSHDHYTWYLLMVNMPFFKDKLSWGTSVRGAWWDCNQGPFDPNKRFELKYCLYDPKDANNQVQNHLNLSLTKEEWEAFIKALLEFSGI